MFLLMGSIFPAFLRRTIEKVTKENEDGSTYTAYTYEEATVLKTEYSVYLASQNEANIEYIACMSDIEL